MGNENKKVNEAHASRRYAVKEIMWNVQRNNISNYSIFNMAYVSDYAFQNISRLGDDSCSIDQRTVQNSLAADWILQNYFAQDCTMRGTMNLATSQPCVNYVGGYGAAGGCNIDDSSKLLIGSVQTHPRCHIDLFQRPFATVPFLGRGSVDPVVESQMLQGEQVTNKKSVTRLTEKNHEKYRKMPLIPEVETFMNGRVNGIGSDNMRSVPTRELNRDVK